MKKNVVISILATACIFAVACSDVSAPDTMCWDETITYQEAQARHITAQFIKETRCDEVINDDEEYVDCTLKRWTYRRCVDNVEFK